MCTLRFCCIVRSLLLLSRSDSPDSAEKVRNAGFALRVGGDFDLDLALKDDDDEISWLAALRKELFLLGSCGACSKEEVFD